MSATRRMLLLLSPVLAAAALPDAAEPDPVPSWFGQLMHRLAQIPSSQSDFVEEKQIAALDRPLRSQGRLVYRQPAHLEKITTAPQPETLIVDGDQLTIRTGDGMPKIFSLANEPAIAGLVDGVRAALAGDQTTLQRLYHIEVQGSPVEWRLDLSPRSAPLTQVLRSVTIDGAETAIRMIRIDQANGDTQTMTITVAQ